MPTARRLASWRCKIKREISSAVTLGCGFCDYQRAREMVRQLRNCDSGMIDHKRGGELTEVASPLQVSYIKLLEQSFIVRFNVPMETKR